MPLRVTPEQAGENWEAGMGRASEKIRAGIARVSVAPGRRAADAADKWLMGVTGARDRFARNAAAVSLEDWRAAVDAAIGNVAAGATRKKGKYVQKVTPVFQTLAGIMARVDAMSTTTYEQRKAKAIAVMDGLHNAKQ